MTKRTSGNLWAESLQDEGYAVKTAANSTDTLAAVRDAGAAAGRAGCVAERIRARWSGDPVPPQGDGPVAARGRDLRPWNGRDGGHGDPARRIRLSRKAFPGRQAHRHRPARTRKLRSQARKLTACGAPVGVSNELVGRSSIMAQLLGSIDKIALTNSRILISGPPGSGKELVARTDSRKIIKSGRPVCGRQRRKHG